MRYLLPISVFIILCICGKTYSHNKEHLNFGIHEDTATKFLDKPKIAALASAFVPGAGQAYNKKFWKVPIVWGGGLALYSYFNYNNRLYLQVRKKIESYDSAGLNSTMVSSEVSDRAYQKLDYYRKNRDRALILMGLFYFANIMEAYVDAHLIHFDISNDLTLNWTPAMENINLILDNNQGYTIGLNVRLQF